MIEKLSLLKSEIKDDASRIDRLFRRFEDVWTEFCNRSEYSLLVESAFTVNQIYTGIERIFRNIAASFENSIDETLWHRSLLDRMKLEIENVRPAFISEESYECLKELLAFRHYFRHAYDSDIKEEKFRIVAENTLHLRNRIGMDLDRFIRVIDELKGSM